MEEGRGRGAGVLIYQRVLSVDGEGGLSDCDRFDTAGFVPFKSYSHDKGARDG